MRKRRGNLHDVSDDVIKRLYCKELLSQDEIGMRFGVTRQAVCARMKSLNIEYRGGPVASKCLNCGLEYQVARKRVKMRQTKYCSQRCYFEATSLYGTWSRHGQRVARKVMAAQLGEIVHHINGDATDNRRENLMKFKSNAAHMSFHKSGAARLLKEKIEAGELRVTPRPPA